MSALGEVSHEDIQRLRDIDLTDLVRRLIALECDENGLAAYQHVNLKINIPDGGEDGRVFWHEGPTHTLHLPSRLCIFQIKASIGPTAAGQEVLTGEGRVKPRIERTLNARGAYVLVCGKALEQDGIDDRIDFIGDALLTAGVAPQLGQIQVIDANQLRDWANKYVAAIAFVLSKAGRLPPAGTETWEEISEHENYASTYSRGDSQRDEAETAVREFLVGAEKVARVHGLAGLGKTRLVIEASRPTLQHPKLKGVLFVDAALLREQVVIFARQCRQNGCSGILIVDNCDEDTHSALTREARHPTSRLRMLTIGNEAPPPLEKIPTIELAPVNAAVIEAQINAICPGLPQQDVEFITQNLAEGFPQMAVLLAQARLGEVTDIRDILRADLVARLVGLDADVDSEPLRTLRLCSIFTRLGFEIDRSNDYKQMALFERLSPERFFEHVQGFLKRGIINKTGRFIEVRPKPLAWRLAADWWARCSPDKVQRLLDCGLSEDLSNSLCERVRMLDGVPDIVDLVARLCQPAAPFGRAELLNTELGSRLFRAFSEVNPSACARAVSSAFHPLPVEVLKLEVGSGRRNLVWALERLAFWAETFPQAARTLFKFALAENESWSNNATGVLASLYSPLLSGTQAPPSLRIDVLIDGLAEYQDQAIPLVLQCCSTALKSSHFSRTAGPEQQGARPPQRDWRPKIWQELFDYWDRIAELLMHFFESETHGAKAVTVAAQNIRGLFVAGRLELLSRVLAAIRACPSESWPAAVDALSTIRRHDLKNAPVEAGKFVEDWVQRLTPQGLRERLLIEISQPPWDHEEDSKGIFVDVSADRAIALARDMRELRELQSTIDVLLFGQQRQTYVFARELGATSSQICRLFAAAANAYRRRPVGDWNFSFFAGLAEGAARRTDLATVVRSVISHLSHRRELVGLLIPTCIAVGLTAERLKDIQRAIDDGLIQSQAVSALGYGRATDLLNPEVISEFCLHISSFGGEFCWVALDVLAMYCHGREDRRAACADALLDLLKLANFDEKSNVMDVHHWASTAKSLVRGGSEQTARQIAQVLSESILSGRFDVQHTSELQEVVSDLLKRHPSLWEVFGATLLPEEWKVSTAAHSLLGDRLGDKSERTPVQSVPDSILLDWCREIGPQAAAALLSIYPPFEAEDTFSNLSIVLLEEFASERIFSAFTANIYSFSWWGSAAPYYRRLLSSFESLRSEARSNELRTWARKEIAACKKMIERQEIEDSERS